MLSRQLSLLTKTGRFAEAARLLDRAIATAPRDEKLQVALAQVHNYGTKRFGAALAAADRAIRIRPNSAAAHAERAHALGEQQRNADALISASRAVSLDPGRVRNHHVRATLLRRLGRLEEADTSVLRALHLDPGFVASRLLRASIQRGLGNIDLAKTICADVFRDAPDTLDLYPVHMANGTLDQDDPLMRYFERSIAPRHLDKTTPQAVIALQVMARFRDDCGDHGAALALLARAKSIEDLPHDGPAYAQFVSDQISGITRGEHATKGGSDSDQPVLIVGMPRSGSTLLEQVLAAHGQIGGAGESPALGDLLTDLGVPRRDAKAMIAATNALSDAKARQMAARYLASIRKQSGGTPRLILDKNLHNFELLGFFTRLFPKAKILHVTRDPLDCCVSCYVQNMTPWHSYTRDLGDLGRYYTQYRRLMAHWAKVLPNPMMSVPYEAMITETEATARAVIRFLGLDWDPACLSYKDRGLQANTLSAVQVRQPIYTTSIGKWTRYEPHLGPLKSELAAFYPAGFDAAAI